MEYTQHIDFFFQVLICGIAAFAVKFLGKMSDNISKMTISIRELNIKMAAVTDRLSHFDKEIYDHEIRIRKVEIDRGHSRKNEINS